MHNKTCTVSGHCHKAAHASFFVCTARKRNRLIDTLTPEQRSRRMAAIRSKDTKPELTVRSVLHRLGYRYRLHRRDIPGRPDICLIGRRKVIFVHGCFWHGHDNCKIANLPKSRTEYWAAKFRYNKQRDAAAKQVLAVAGWNCCVVWECEIQGGVNWERRLMDFLGPPKLKASAPPDIDQERTSKRWIPNGSG
ncbi:very short patch repair endonuclease [Aminobacter aminovorans]|uniref:very short patch repair endonuclease n=1 Tax=Aminobacter aminovorans TaxID=83263 RepID=UPI0024786D54|nr:very short patch repair endonuclease [Aminobacter aminovorans]